MARARYELLELLGRGGFGEVRRARLHGEDQFTREVAIKLLREDADADAARRLRDEARLLGLLRHPAIVQVIELTQIDGRPAIVMELIEGMPLSAYCSYGRTVPLRPAVEIVAQVAQALDEAWSAPGPGGRPLRVLHRDIKPGNLLLTPRGEVKVLDFGVAQARFDTREASTSKELYGTLGYMAPERRQATAGPSVDVFALGGVLFELVRGERFGPAPQDCVEYEAHLNAALVGLPAEARPIDPLLRCMLAHAPEARPTAAGVVQALTTFRLQLDSEAAGAPETEPDLRAWAEPAVRRYLDRQGCSESSAHQRSWGTTTGRLLTRTMALLGLLGVGAGLALASALGVVAQRGAPTSEGTPAKAEPGWSDTLRAPRSPATAPPAPAPASSEEPAPTPPAVTPEGPAAPTRAPEVDLVEVGLTGDLPHVFLVGDRGRFIVPGRVPPGSYQVEARFPRWGLRAADQVSVSSEGAVIHCSDGFGSCGSR